jgi:hypothetical protein
MLLLTPLLASVLASASPIHCLTPQFLAMRGGPFDMARLHRPGEAGFVDSAIYPIRVHYAKPGDADRAANAVLPAAEDVWSKEIDAMGWPQPPADDGAGGDDSYDFYLTEEGTAGGAYTYGFGPDVTPGDDWYSNPTFIALDDRIPDDQMEAFIAHEFNHASQYTIDAVERTLFAWESTAEAIADIVYDDTDYGYELASFQQLPFMSLLFDSYSREMQPYGYTSYYYEYGGMMFTTYLEEKYGTKDGTVLLKLWDDLAQPSQVDEPDFLDAVAEVDPSVPSVAAVYTDFSVWRMFTGSNDDGAHYEEGGDFPAYATVVPDDTIDLADLDGYSASPGIEPYDIGGSYYLIHLGEGTDRVLHVDVTGDAGAQWGLAWAVWPTADGPALTGSRFVADGEPLSADIDLSGGFQAEIGVVNNGPDGLDPNEDDPKQRNFTVSFTLADGATTGETTGGADETTGGGGSDSTEKGGCGCDDSAGGGPGLAVALAAFAVGRRRLRLYAPLGMRRF